MTRSSDPSTPPSPGSPKKIALQKAQWWRAQTEATSMFLSPSLRLWTHLKNLLISLQWLKIPRRKMPFTARTWSLSQASTPRHFFVFSTSKLAKARTLSPDPKRETCKWKWKGNFKRTYSFRQRGKNLSHTYWNRNKVCVCYQRIPLSFPLAIPVSFPSNKQSAPRISYWLQRVKM